MNKLLSAISILLSILAATTTTSISAETYYSQYGSSQTNYAFAYTDREYTYEIDGIAWYKQTYWFIDDEYIGMQDSGWRAIDPSIAIALSSDTTVSAFIYDESDYIETHTWYVFTIEPPKPDLSISSSDIQVRAKSGSTIELNEKFDVYVTIENRGDADSGSFNVKYYYNSTSSHYDTDYNNGIDAGDTDYETSDSYTASSSGSNYVYVCIYNHSNDESSSNDCAKKTFTVNEPPKPDLSISSSDIQVRAKSGSTIELNEKFDVYVTIENRGDADSGSFNVKYYYNSTSSHYDTDSNNGIDAGDTDYETSDSYTASSSGSNYVYVCIYNHSNDESSSNDCAKKTFTVNEPPKSDLSISSSDIQVRAKSGSTIELNEKFDVYVTIENRGDADSGSFNVKYYYNSTSSHYDTDSNNGIDASDTDYETSDSYTASSSGSNYVYVCIYNHSNDESSSNDCAKKTFTVNEPPKSDLSISSSDIQVRAKSGSTIELNEKFDVYVTIENRGDADSGSFNVKYYYNSTSSHYDTDSNNGIDAGDTDYETSDSYTASSSGSNYVYVCIYNHSNDESSSNDCAKKTFTVNEPPKPDLEIISASYDPNPPVLESDVLFSATVKNTGDADWDQSLFVGNDDFSVEFYVAGDYVCSDTNSGDLEEADSEVFSCTASASKFSVAGAKQVEAVIVTGSNAVEQNANNNTYDFGSVTWVEPPEPDLEIISLSYSPNPPVLEGDVEFFATVQNVGNAAWDQALFTGDDDFTVEFYVSGNHVCTDTNWNDGDLGVNVTEDFSCIAPANKFATAGDKLVEAVIIVGTNAMEQDTSNDGDELTVEWQPAPRPNLEIQNIYQVPGDISNDPNHRGDSVDICAVATNSGDADADAFTIKFYQNDDQATGSSRNDPTDSGFQPIGERTVGVTIGDVSVFGLGAGATDDDAECLSVPVNMGGSMQFRAVADAGDAIDEIYNGSTDNEEDNTEDIAFAWPYIYDVDISNVQFAASSNQASDSSSYGYINDSIHMNVTFTSSGDASNNYELYLLIQTKNDNGDYNVKYWESTERVLLDESSQFLTQSWLPEVSGSYELTAAILDPAGNILSSYTSQATPLYVDRLRTAIYDVAARETYAQVGDKIEITGRLGVDIPQDADAALADDKTIHITLTSGAEYQAITAMGGNFTFTHTVTDADASLEVVGASYEVLADEQIYGHSSGKSELFLVTDENDEVDTLSTISIKVSQDLIDQGAVWRISPAGDIFGYSGNWITTTKITNVPLGEYTIEFGADDDSLSTPEAVNLNISKASIYEIQPHYVYLGEDVIELVSYIEEDGDTIAIKAEVAANYENEYFNYLLDDPNDYYSNFTVTRNNSIYLPPKRTLNLLTAALEKKVYENTFDNYTLPIDHLYREQRVRSFTCESTWWWSSWNTCGLHSPSGLTAEERKASYKAIIKRALYESPLVDQAAYSASALGETESLLVATVQMPAALVDKTQSILVDNLGEDLLENFSVGSNAFDNIVSLVSDSQDNPNLQAALLKWLSEDSLSSLQKDAAFIGNIKNILGLVNTTYSTVNGFAGAYEQFAILNDVMVQDGIIAAKLDALQNAIDEVTKQGRGDLIDQALAEAVAELRQSIMVSQADFFSKLALYVDSEFTLSSFIEFVDTVASTSYSTLGNASKVLGHYKLTAKKVAVFNKKLEAFASPLAVLNLTVNVTGVLDDADNYMKEVQLLPNVLAILYDYAGYSEYYLTDGTYDNIASYNTKIVNTANALESSSWLNIFQMFDHFYFDWISLEVSSIDPDWHTVVNSTINVAFDSAAILFPATGGAALSNWINIANSGVDIGAELGLALNQWGSDTELYDLIARQQEMLTKYGLVVERADEWKSVVNNIFPQAEDLELVLETAELVISQGETINIALSAASITKVEEVYVDHSWSLLTPEDNTAELAVASASNLAAPVSFIADAAGIYRATLLIATEYGEARGDVSIQVIDPEADALADDSDGDGIPDNQDHFPSDIAASVDDDGDGYPDFWNAGYGEQDSATGLILDACPNNKWGWADADGDSFCQDQDQFIDDPAASVDSDADGHPDYWNAGYTGADSTSRPALILDMYPADPALGGDSDGDGYVELVVGYSVSDVITSPLPTIDLFPLDPNEWLDSDADGWGDNIDACDDAYGYLDEDSDGVCQPDDELDNVPGRFSNTAPVCQAQTISGLNGSTISGTLACSDIEGDQLVDWAIYSEPSKGSLELSLDSSGIAFTYTNDVSDLTALDYFAYRVYDQYGAVSDLSEVYVNITDSINSVPVANDMAFNVQLGDSFSGQLEATDADNDHLSYSIVSYTVKGSLSIDSSTGEFIFTSSANDDSDQNYETEFTYIANDGLYDSNIATVRLLVSNDPDGDGIDSENDNCPVVANNSQSDLDGDSVGDACDSDIDGDNVANDSDAFPNDPSETLDSDGDGIGNNADEDDDGDSMPDEYELANGLDPLDAADAALDNDGDGDSNLQEYINNTDPNDADDYYYLTLVLESESADVESATGVSISFEYSIASSTDTISDYDFIENTSPANGTLSYSNNKYIIYESDPSFIGTDAFALALSYNDKLSNEIAFNVSIYAGDPDSDGIISSADNCPDIANPEQSDLDNDSIGDVCDPDIDGDGYSNADEESAHSDSYDPTIIPTPINVFTGWNFIALSLPESGFDVENLPSEIILLSTIDSELGALGWSRDYELTSAEQLTILRVRQAYWIKSNADFIWNYPTTTATDAEELRLSEGANYIGGQQGQVQQVLASIADEMFIAWGYEYGEWFAYSSSSDVNEDLMRRGILQLTDIDRQDGLVVMLGSASDLDALLAESIWPELSYKVGSAPTIDVLNCTADYDERMGYVQLVANDYDGDLEQVYWYSDGLESTFEATVSSVNEYVFDYSASEGDKFLPVVMVSDAQGNNSSASCAIDLSPEQNYASYQPVANITVNPDNIVVGDEVTLDGSGSSDPNGDDLTYAWSQPVGQGAHLSSVTMPSATFTADAEGTYSFTLMVDDGKFTDNAIIDLLVKPIITPTDLAAEGGEGQATLTWTPYSIGTSYNIYRSDNPDCDLSNISYCSSITGQSTIISSVSSPFVDTGLINNTTYYYWIEATLDGDVQLADDYVSATPQHTTTTNPIPGTLNDTGIDWHGDYPAGNRSNCNSDTSAPQDCHQGRDATNDDDSDGHAGFSFTKLDRNGNALAASATVWSCVRDNVTGFVWEVKTDDGSIHDKDNTYRWGGISAIGYDSDSREGEYYEDWDTLVNGANDNKLCGYEDWRVPNINELAGIADLSKYDPAIDTNYFPNTISSMYWSASPSANNYDEACKIYFYNGSDSCSYSDRNEESYIRLVRFKH